MNTDIRISVVFWRHPKTVKLERRLGIEAIKSLIILWMWVACNRPDGNLEGFDAEDIEIAAEWRGEPGVLVEVLLSLRWLDMEDGQYKIHDWAEHNSWASEAECRSDVARFSKLAQVNPAACEELRRLGISSLTPEEYQEWKNYSPIIHQRIASERTANASDSHSKRKANASGALAPSPSPSLKIKEKDPPPSPPGGNPRCAPPVAHLPP